MKILKIIGFVLLGIVVILVAAIAMTSQQKHLERSILINATPAQVFAEVNTYKSFNKWSDWAAQDPEAKYVYEGPDSGIGAKISWDGKVVGKGGQWIVASEENKRVRNQLEFADFKGAFYADFILEPAGAGTQVTWTYDGDYTGTGVMNSSMGKVFNWFMESLIGESYERGLASLKSYVESTPPSTPEESMMPADSTTTK